MNALRWAVQRLGAFAAILTGALLLGFAVVSCTATSPSFTGGGNSTGAPEDTTGVTASGAPNASSETGTIGLELQLSPGITLSTLQYVITNPTLAGFATRSGSVDVGGSLSIGFSIALPVGSGYEVSLSAADSDGDGCTAGPASFSVLGGQTNVVGLTLRCAQPSDGGFSVPDVHVANTVFMIDASLQPTGVQGICAAANSLSASPNNATVGHTIALTAAGIDSNYQTSDVTLTWTALGGAGSLTGSTGTSNTFACAAQGTETVTVTAAVSDGGGSCPTIGSLSFTLTCDPSDAGPLPSGLIAGVSAAGGTATFHTGALPPPNGSTTVTVPASRTVAASGSTPIDIGSSSLISTAYVGVKGSAGSVIGYWEVDFLQGVSLADLVVSFGPDLPMGSFSVFFEVGGSSGEVSAASQTTFFPVDLTNPPPPPPSPVSAECLALGDPHLRTFDGLRYDCQPVGELTLARSVSGDLEVQTRTTPWGARTDVAVHSAVAAQVGTDRVAFYKDGTTTLNRAVKTFGGGKTPLAGGGVVYGVANGYAVVWPDMSQMQLDFGGDFIGVRLFLPATRSGQVAGLCGNFDGSTSNDLVTPDGMRTLVSPTPFTQFYGTYVNSWRITDATSLLDYGPGQGTATFTDLTFPHVLASAASVSATDTASAKATCAAAGVLADWMDACVVDVAFTGNSLFARELALAAAAPAVLTVQEPPCATPTFSPAMGGVAAGTSVTLASDYLPAGGLIFYTLDGTVPSHGGPALASGGSISISQGETIHAIASAAPMCSDSNMATAVYTVPSKPSCPSPTFAPNGGAIVAGSNISITATNLPTGGFIYYTTDGTSPTHSAPLYSGPIQVNQSETVRALSSAPTCTDSAVAVGVFTTVGQQELPLPSFTPTASIHNNEFLISLSVGTPGAVICYTLDGVTIPTCSTTATAVSCTGTSKAYSASIPIDGTVTSVGTGTVSVQAIACGVGYKTGPRVIQTYTLQVGSPMMVNPAPGNILYANMAAAPVWPTPTISTDTPGASIQYTTDGTSTPTCGAASPGIATGSAIRINKNTAISAIGCKTGYAPSSMPDTLAYTIQLNPPVLPENVVANSPVIIDDTANGGSGDWVCATADGSTPGCGATAAACSAGVSTAITPIANTVVKAIACGFGLTPSTVATGGPYVL